MKMHWDFFFFFFYVPFNLLPPRLFSSMKEAAVKDGVIKNKIELQLAGVVMMVWAALCITSMAAAAKSFT